MFQPRSQWFEIRHNKENYTNYINAAMSLSGNTGINELTNVVSYNCGWKSFFWRTSWSTAWSALETWHLRLITELCKFWWKVQWNEKGKYRTKNTLKLAAYWNSNIKYAVASNITCVQISYNCRLGWSNSILSSCSPVFLFMTRPHWGPVHTDAFSFENANILLRFHVPSTHHFENCNFYKDLYGGQARLARSAHLPYKTL